MGDALKYKLEIEKRPLPKAFVVCMLVAFLGCAAAICGWKYSLDVRGIQWKSQSSQYSSLGRAQAAMRHLGEYDMIFLGSSITGRIPGVESGYNRWADLGIDGSSAEEGIALVLNNIMPSVPYAVIETDSLFLHRPFISPNPEKDFGDRWVNRFIMFSPLYRFSSLLWTELRHETFNADDAAPYACALPVAGKADRAYEKPRSWNDKDQALLEMLCRLKTEKGMRLMLVNYPNAARKIWGGVGEKSHYVAQVLDVPFLDLNESMDKDIHIEFSDGIHMKCKYALRVAATLYQIMHQ